MNWSLQTARLRVGGGFIRSDPILILQDIHELRVKEHNARKTNLRSVVVTLSPAEGFPSEAIGVKLEKNDDAFVVSDVSPGSVAHRAQVQVGFVHSPSTAWNRQT